MDGHLNFQLTRSRGVCVPVQLPGRRHGSQAYPVLLQILEVPVVEWSSGLCVPGQLPGRRHCSLVYPVLLQILEFPVVECFSGRTFLCRCEAGYVLLDMLG